MPVAPETEVPGRPFRVWLIRHLTSFRAAPDAPRAALAHAQAELDQVVNLSGGDDPAEPHGSAIIERSRALAEQFEQESGLLRATRDELRPRVEPDGPTTTDQGSP